MDAEEEHYLNKARGDEVEDAGGALAGAAVAQSFGASVALQAQCNDTDNAGVEEVLQRSVLLPL